MFKSTHYIALVAATLMLGATPVVAQDKNPTAGQVFSGLKFRNIGPALISGRVSDIAVDKNDINSFYVATASGGLWKTTNNGISWDPVFDKEASYSLGVVEIDPNNSAIVWAGTGENNAQRSIAFGDGIYKSINGGKSWKNMGLPTSEHIGQIVIDPRDSDTVFVAAQGPLWNSGGDRGVYKTTDGGATWVRTLNVDEHTGANEILMNSDNPDIMIASTYQRQRHLWTMIDGGPGGGIHRSTDGGETWSKITSGLPGGDLGKIGLAASPSHPNIIYAVVEADTKGKGLYRSTNFGVTWEKRSSKTSGGPMYYNEITVDPNDPNRIYLVDTFLSRSEDGGKSFNRVPIKHKHVDSHVLWVNPDNSNHIREGNDGGLYESFDRGENWRHYRNIPIAQFYRINADNEFPFYNVYGGTQDNYSLEAPSRTVNTHGIVTSDWKITWNGDGFETAVDPVDSNIIYPQLQHGNIGRFDRTTGESVSIQPQPEKGENAYRWNWNSPVLVSHHDHKRLYFGSEFLFRSDDQGNSWRKISGDLSRNINRNELEIMGRVWSVDAIAKNSSTSKWGSLISVSESSLDENLIFVGTDDGLIQITENGGETWTKTDKFKGVPDRSYVGRIETSSHDANVAYAAFDNHKMGDFKPYILKTTDKGKSWKLISNNLPERGMVHAIVEDHVDPNLVFIGTEYGVFVTQDGGDSWSQLKGGLPTISIRDLDIQARENDLTVASFGRGYYILDDYSPLRFKAADIGAEEATLFPIKDAWQYVPRRPMGFGRKGFSGEEFYSADNHPSGAVFSYYLKDGLKTKKAIRQASEKKAKKAGEDNPYPSWEDLRAEDNEEKPALIFTIKDADGDVVRKITGPASKGFHRIEWDYKGPAGTPITNDGDGGGFGGPPTGYYQMPGEYSVSMAKRVDGVTTELSSSQSFMVKDLFPGLFDTKDPEGLSAYWERIWDLRRALQGAGRAMGEVNSRIGLIMKALDEMTDSTTAQQSQIRAIKARVVSLQTLMNGDRTIGRRGDPVPMAISQRLNGVAGAQFKNFSDITDDHKKSFEIASEEFGDALRELKSITGDLSVLEGQLDGIGPWTMGRIPDWNPK